MQGADGLTGWPGVKVSLNKTFLVLVFLIYVETKNLLVSTLCVCEFLPFLGVLFIFLYKHYLYII